MRNIRISYLLSFLSECYLPFTTWLFFYLRHFSYAEIATLTAVQMLTTVIFEIPTGAFADLVGRKTSLILSFLLGGTALALFPFGETFLFFAILEVVKGISNSLYSGSKEALVYDTLKENKREDFYPRISSNIETLEWSAILVAALVSGFIHSWNFRLPWLFQAGMYGIAFIAAFGLREPKIDSVKVTFRSALKQNVIGLQELFADSKRTSITLQLTVIGSGYVFGSHFLGITQAEEYGSDPRAVGLIFGLGYVCSIIASRLYPRLRDLWGEKMLLLTTSAMLIASYLGASIVGSPLGSALIILRIASSSTFRNTRSLIVNSWISSKNRATALSTLYLITQLPYILFVPLLGAAADKSSPNSFSLFLGQVILLLSLLLYILRTVRLSHSLREA